MLQGVPRPPRNALPRGAPARPAFPSPPLTAPRFQTEGEPLAAALFPHNYEMPTQRVMVYAGANDPVNDPEGIVPAALANRGCCQQSETTNICMDEEYPGGACVPLAGRTIDCAAGHWNPNAQYSQGFCVNGITLPLDGVESCDARVAVRMTACECTNGRFGL